MENYRTTQELRNDFNRQSWWLQVFSFFLRLITLIAVFTSIILILNGVDETRHQTVISQKYIRCIVLLPNNPYVGTTEQRTKTIDSCADQSQIPTKESQMSSVNNRDILNGSLLILVIIIVISFWFSHSRFKKLAIKIDEVHDEVKTGNSQTLAQLADADESRRINKIPQNEQTDQEKNHIRDLNK